MIRLGDGLARIRRKGLLGSLRVLGERLGCYRWRLVLLERDLTLPHQHRRNRNLRVVRITSALLPAVAQQFAHYGDDLAALYRSGQTGYALLTPTDDVVGMTWVANQDYYDSQLYRCLIPVPAECAYQFTGEIVPAYRRTGAVVALLEHIWQDQERQGCRRMRVLINRRNLPALKLHLGLDFEELGEEVEVFCLFGRLHYHRWRRYPTPSLDHLRRLRRTAPAAAGA
jgi:L-amino acid N-acyltransferase YncA